MRGADEYQELLSNFQSLNNKDSLSQRLENLHLIHESLYIVIENIASLKIAPQINDTFFSILLNYLSLKSDSESNILFSIFESDTLNLLFPIYPLLEKLFQSDQSKFVIICDAVALYKLNSNWVNLKWLYLLTELNDYCLKSNLGIQFLNKIDPEIIDSKKLVKVLNLLQNEFTKLPYEKLFDLLTIEKITLYFTIIDKLNYLKIEPDCLSQWLLLDNLDERWFTKNEKTKILSTLDKRVISGFGFKYVLSKIPFMSFDHNLVDMINYLISTYMHDANKESEWLTIGNFFDVEANKIANHLERMADLIKKIRRNPLHSLDSKILLKRTHDLLLLREDIIGKNNDITKLYAFVHLDNKVYCSEGFKLLERIKSLGINLSHGYILNFNKIVAKPQLAYVGTLNSLSDKWLTQEGLMKLNLFSEKYLSPEGLKFISLLNVDKITDEIINEINSSTHNTILNYKDEYLSDKQMSLETVLPLRIKRNNLIQAYTQKLKTTPLPTAAINNENPDQLARRNANTRFLLQGNCLYSECPFISNSDNEAVIYIDDTRVAPITLEELNKVLCLIDRPGESDSIVTRAKAQQYAEMKRNHPYKQDVVFTSEHILNFSADNINIDTINKNYKLGQNQTDLGMSLTIQSLKCDQLLDVQFLEDLPEVFFQEETNLAFLLRMDANYLKNKLLLIYLNKYIGNEINDDKIIFLNNNIKNILNFCENNIGKDINILQKLPDIFFTSNYILFLESLNPFYFSERVELIDGSFNALVYLASILGNMVSENAIKKLNSLVRINFFPNLKSEMFHGIDCFLFEEKFKIVSRLFQLACEDLSFAVDFFRNNKEKIFSDEEFKEILKSHMQQENFIELVKTSTNYLTIKLCEKFKANSDKELCNKLFTLFYLASKENQLFDAGLYEVLKNQNRILLQREMQLRMKDTKYLTKLVNFHNKVMVSFKAKLHHYETHRLRIDKEGNLTTKWTRTARQRLTAFNELKNAVDSEKSLPDILYIISAESENIGLHDSPSHFFKGLQAYCSELYESHAFLDILFKDVFEQCTKDATGRTMGFCLLNDVFYSLLDNKQLIELAEINPVIFNTVMEKHRPSHSTVRSKKPTTITTLSSKSEISAPFEAPKQSGFSHPKEAISLQRIQMSCEYQLQDVDINAGLLILREDIPKETLSTSKLSCSLDAELTINEVAFLTFGPIDQEPNIVGYTLDAIRDIAHRNKEKLCFGIMNINRNHYFSLCVQETAEGIFQIIVIDPAFQTPEKKHTLDKIHSILTNYFKEKCDITIVGDISQQFNDSDCGIACLQTGWDIIHKKAITSVNGVLKLYRENLTLDARVGKEAIFVELAIKIRKRWEDALSKLDSIFIIYPDGQKIPAGPYSFASNKQLQSLKIKTQDLLDEIIKNFLIVQRNIFNFQLYDVIPTMADYQGVIIEFKKSDERCTTYMNNLQQMNDILKKYPSEVITFNNSTIDEKIIRQLQVSYRDAKVEGFNKEFFKYLKSLGQPIEKVTEEELAIAYVEFVQIGKHTKWIEFFSNENWDHFRNVNLYINNIIKEEKSNSRSTMVSFFSHALSERQTFQSKRASTKKSVSEVKKEQDIKIIKGEMTGALQQLLINLKKYPLKPQRPPFDNWHTSQKKVTILEFICQNALASLENINDLRTLEKIRIKICGRIFKAFKGSTNWLGFIRWDEVSLGYLLKDPLAKLLGISAKKLEKYSTHQVVEIERRIYPSSNSYQTWLENTSDIYHANLQVRGYEYLAEVIEDRFNDLVTR